MEKSYLNATIRSRILAFLIDLTIVYFFRSLYLFVALTYWFEKKTLLFFGILKEDMGLDYNDVHSITVEHIEFFLNSDYFTNFVFFVSGIFLVSILYNFVCFCFLKASLGQRVFKIHIADRHGENVNKLKFLQRSVLIIVPWIVLFLTVFQIVLSKFKLSSVDNSLVTLFLLLFLSWYDLIFFTGEKIVLHDFFSKTMPVFDDPNRKEYLIERILPNPRAFFAKVKKGFREQFDTFKELKNSIKNNKK
jgi:uncharacterized RDD family membrane protein YckC